jgi:hypothetical protein
MSKIRLLADANLDQNIVRGLIRCEPLIDFEVAQFVIPQGTPDPEVLAIAADLRRVLVSHDRKTMPRHFADFLAHRDSPGVMLIPTTYPVVRAIDQLLLIWHASPAEEWTNCLRWISL